MPIQQSIEQPRLMECSIRLLLVMSRGRSSRFREDPIIAGRIERSMHLGVTIDLGADPRPSGAHSSARLPRAGLHGTIGPKSVLPASSPASQIP